MTREEVPQFLRRKLKADMERREIELYAAWMAGYNYLLEWEVITDNFNLVSKYIPTNREPKHTMPRGTATIWTIKDEELTPETKERLEEYKPGVDDI